MAGNAQNESIHGQLDNDGLATFLAALPDVSRPVISQWFRSGGTVEWKSDDSPVTMADKAAELALRNAIIAAFPDDEILGEEHAARQGSSGYSGSSTPFDVFGSESPQGRADRSSVGRSRRKADSRGLETADPFTGNIEERASAKQLDMELLDGAGERIVEEYGALIQAYFERVAEED